MDKKNKEKEKESNKECELLHRMSEGVTYSTMAQLSILHFTLPFYLRIYQVNI